MRYAALALFAFAWGCGDGGGGEPPGSERGPCYPNGTCNAGLSCLSNVCVNTGGGAGGAPACGTAGQACGGAAPCCSGAVCATNTCAAICVSDSDCASGCCWPLASGERACRACGSPGQACSSAAPCRSDAVCLTTSNTCAAICVSNSDCASGCCHSLANSTQRACMAGGTAGQACGSAALCCTDYICATPSYTCAAICVRHSDCASGCCALDNTGQGACMAPVWCL
jgi:hypothetical protein